jgi:hypothetical protein
MTPIPCIHKNQYLKVAFYRWPPFFLKRQKMIEIREKHFRCLALNCGKVFNKTRKLSCHISSERKIESAEGPHIQLQTKRGPKTKKVRRHLAAQKA